MLSFSQLHTLFLLQLNANNYFICQKLFHSPNVTVTKSPAFLTIRLTTPVEKFPHI